MRSLVAAYLICCASVAVAQEGVVVQGIGFAQSEAGAWLCRHEDPAEALACAAELCAEQSPGVECRPTTWCFPSGWSGVMNVRLQDFQASHALCGAPSEKALTDALAAMCAADAQVAGCDLTLIVDPDGNERRIENTTLTDAGWMLIEPTPAPDAMPADAAPADVVSDDAADPARPDAPAGDGP